MNNLPSNASACLTTVNRDAKSFTETETVSMGQDSRFPGKVVDIHAPNLTPQPTALALIPQSWIDESEENLVSSVDWMGVYYSHGVATASFSDQVNSLSQSQRDAALMALFPDEHDLWSNLFPKMYANQISDKTKFPSVFNANHAGPLLIGPLKEDKPWEWTLEERKEKCISSQEAIYGTELLKRLEAIKMAVDPNFMFNCHDCIGNNLDLAKEPQAKPSADEPSSASSAPVYAAAAAISATVILFLPILN